MPESKLDIVRRAYLSSRPEPEIHELLDALEVSEAEVERLRGDSERLDWLERATLEGYSLHIELSDASGPWSIHACPKPHGYQNIRAAIDAAARAKGERMSEDLRQPNPNRFVESVASDSSAIHQVFTGSSALAVELSAARIELTALREANEALRVRAEKAEGELVVKDRFAVSSGEALWTVGRILGLPATITADEVIERAKQLAASERRVEALWKALRIARSCEGFQNWGGGQSWEMAQVDAALALGVAPQPTPATEGR